MARKCTRRFFFFGSVVIMGIICGFQFRSRRYARLLSTKRCIFYFLFEFRWFLPRHCGPRLSEMSDHVFLLSDGPSTRSIILPMIFPAELFEKISDEVADCEDGMSTLRSLSLVCSSLVNTCQRHLFRSVDLGTKVGREERQVQHLRLLELLDRYPHLRSHIRNVNFAIGKSDLGKNQPNAVAEILSRLHLVESFSIVWIITGNVPLLDWDRFPRSLPLYSSLTRIIQGQRLRRFLLCRVANFPANILVHDTRDTPLHLSMPLSQIRWEEDGVPRAILGSLTKATHVKDTTEANRLLMSAPILRELIYAGESSLF